MFCSRETHLTSPKNIIMHDSFVTIPRVARTIARKSDVLLLFALLPKPCGDARFVLLADMAVQIKTQQTAGSTVMVLPTGFPRSMGFITGIRMMKGTVYCLAIGTVDLQKAGA